MCVRVHEYVRGAWLLLLCSCYFFMQVDFVNTYMAELALWPGVQTANFSLVSLRHAGPEAALA